MCYIAYLNLLETSRLYCWCLSIRLYSTSVTYSWFDPRKLLIS